MNTVSELAVVDRVDEVSFVEEYNMNLRNERGLDLRMRALVPRSRCIQRGLATVERRFPESRPL